MNWGIILTAAVPVVILVIEYLLPKTDKVKANSIVESILNLIQAFLGKK